MLRNGWQLYAYALFEEAFFDSSAAFRNAKRTHPDDWRQQRAVRRHARLLDLIEKEIPANPNAPGYLLGNTLGPEHRHWRRAKFFGRYRLFFRFSSAQKIIVFAWLNDEHSLRKEGSATDPYRIFRNRLDAQRPPDDWDDLLAQSRPLGPG